MFSCFHESIRFHVFSPHFSPKNGKWSISINPTDWWAPVELLCVSAHTCFWFLVYKCPWGAYVGQYSANCVLICFNWRLFLKAQEEEKPSQPIKKQEPIEVTPEKEVF